MKVYIVGTRDSHGKNVESIRNTLRLFNVEYEEHECLSKLNSTHTLVLCLNKYFPPSAFPPTCKVIYGPHFFVFPEDKTHPLFAHTYDPTRFFFNTLSPWVNTLYREFTNIDMPFINAFFGITTDSIQSTKECNKTHVMIYFKSTFPEKLQFAENYLTNHAIPYHKIIYGSYKDSEFKETLKNTKFVIWIGRHESQGFALQETLASNVPILLWDVQTMYEEYSNGRIVYESYKHRDYKMIASSAPYWSNDCGIRFLQKEDFESSFQRMMETYTTFRPREYVDRNLSIPVAWHNLLTCIGEL